MPSIAIAIGATAAAGLGGAALGSSAASNAAQTQSAAAEQAAQLQYQSEQQSLAQQQSQFNTTQANEAPFLKAGQGAASQLSSLTGPGGSLVAPYTGTFQAPTAAQAEAMPGYQFQLQQGEEALQRSAAAQGTLLSGNTLTGIENYAQGLAGTNYQNAYQNALGQFQTNYNVWSNNQANKYNRLASLAGLGQTTAGQLGQAGTAASNTYANTVLGTGAQIGQDVQNAAAANASGYVGSANAYGGALSNLSSLAGLLPLYSSLTNGATGSIAGGAADYGTTLPIGG